MDPVPLIEMDQITKRFGSKTAVDGLDITVNEGESFGLLGPNGAGKSTTLDLVLGLTTPTEGTVRIFGTDVQTEPLSVRRRVGVLPENYGVYGDLTGWQHVQTMIQLSGADDSPEKLWNRVGLDRGDLDREVSTFSKGMQQRLALATALVGDPDLLVLDEPTSGLDPDGISRVRELISELTGNGVTVFFSSHRLTEVESVCDRVGIMNDGRLVSVDEVSELDTDEFGTEELRVSLRQPASDETLNRLRAQEAVGSVRSDGPQAVTVECLRPESKSTAVVVLDKAVGVSDFETRDRQLESVFDQRVHGVESVGGARDGGVQT